MWNIDEVFQILIKCWICVNIEKNKKEAKLEFITSWVIIANNKTIYILMVFICKIWLLLCIWQNPYHKIIWSMKTFLFHSKEKSFSFLLITVFVKYWWRWKKSRTLSIDVFSLKSLLNYWMNGYLGSPYVLCILQLYAFRLSQYFFYHVRY